MSLPIQVNLIFPDECQYVQRISVLKECAYHPHKNNQSQHKKFANV